MDRPSRQTAAPDYRQPPETQKVKQYAVITSSLDVVLERSKIWMPISVKALDHPLNPPPFTFNSTKAISHNQTETRPEDLVG
jgi:hypothetical protein